MRRGAPEGGKPGTGRLIFGARGAVERRKDQKGGLVCSVLVCIVLEVFGNAERGADEGRSVAAPRMGGRRDIFVAGERRVEEPAQRSPAA